MASAQPRTAAGRIARETLTALAAPLAVRDLSKRQRKRAAREKRIAAAWAGYDDDRQRYVANEQSPLRPERILAAPA